MSSLPYNYPRRPIVLRGDGVQTESIPMDIFTKPKFLQKFITQCKVNIRKSYEYRSWTQWIRDTFGPPICAVSENIVNIEVHHHPLVLTDYVNLAIQYVTENSFSFTTFTVSDLVIRWHYENIVGTAFMSSTYHARFHDLHDVDIPENKIYGDFDAVVTHPVLSKIGDVEKSKFCRFMPEFADRYYDFFYSQGVMNELNEDKRDPRD